MAMLAHRVIDVEPDSRQPRQEAIERCHRAIAVRQEMIRMSPVRLQPLARLSEAQRAVLRQESKR